MIKIEGSTSVDFGGQHLEFLPDRAIWWPQRSTLLVADAHLGKAASFRSNGLPVPSGSTARDLSRLTVLLQRTNAGRLIVLGDLLHSRAGRQTEVLDAISEWRRVHCFLPMVLVRGNHDRSAGPTPKEWQIDEVEEPFVEKEICLVHDPVQAQSQPTLAGHVHPVFHLRDYDRSAVKLPCFVLDSRLLVLPAFGTFTGGFRVRARPMQEIFVLASDRVVRLGSNGA